MPNSDLRHCPCCEHCEGIHPCPGLAAEPEQPREPTAYYCPEHRTNVDPWYDPSGRCLWMIDGGICGRSSPLWAHPPEADVVMLVDAVRQALNKLEEDSPARMTTAEKVLRDAILPFTETAKP